MKCLILGGDGMHVLNVDKAVYCFDLIASVMKEELEKLGVECYHIQAGKFYGDLYAGDLLQPDTDFVLYVNYAVTDRMNFEWMRDDGIKTIVSLLEVPVQKVDWSFYFVDTGDVTLANSTKIFAPCCKRLYKVLPKQNKIILDHKEENPNNRWDNKIGDTDWTDRISDWVMELDDETAILRMQRFGEKMKLHEFPVIHNDFAEYLAATNCVNTYIVTHAEGYGYSVIDMLARGIRVVAPSGFLNPEFISRFNIPEFNNKEELLHILRSPFNVSLNHCKEWMTDYSDIAVAIIEKVKELNHG